MDASFEAADLRQQAADDGLAAMRARILSFERDVQTPPLVPASHVDHSPSRVGVADGVGDSLDPQALRFSRERLVQGAAADSSERFEMAGWADDADNVATGDSSFDGGDIRQYADGAATTGSPQQPPRSSPPHSVSAAASPARTSGGGGAALTASPARSAKSSDEVELTFDAILGVYVDAR